MIFALNGIHNDVCADVWKYVAVDGDGSAPHTLNPQENLVNNVDHWPI